MLRMKKKLIIFSIIIVILIIIVICLLLLNINNKTNNPIAENTVSNEIIESEVKPIDNVSDLLAIQNCIQKYLERINVNNELYNLDEGQRLDQKIISERTIALLSTEYIEKNSITIENVYDYVNRVEETLTFVPLQINMLELDNTIRYAVYGFSQTGDNQYREDLYFIFNVDKSNNTYSIEPLFNINSIEDIELSNNNLAIEQNKYNNFAKEEISDEDICVQYLFMFKRIMLSKTEESYNYLNTEYRNAKFESEQDYIDYVTNNRDRIATTGLKAYSIKDNEYICQDQRNNYYVFNVNEPCDYDVMLDIYTVDIEEFTNKYNTATNENKVSMNVEKVEAALNNKDYKYVYDKLDETFKNNNYPNLQDFENYMNSNLFNINNLEYVSVAEEGNVYVYKVNIVDNQNNENTKPMTIIMQLQEGTDFVMSFSFE